MANAHLIRLLNIIVGIVTERDDSDGQIRQNIYDKRTFNLTNEQSAKTSNAQLSLAELKSTMIFRPGGSR